MLRSIFHSSFCILNKSKSIQAIYEPYINDHIKKSLLNVSTPNKIRCKNICQVYFQKLVQKQQNQLQKQSQIKTRLNMIFSASFQLQNLTDQQKMICDMILEQKIKTQSELDRILKYIFKEIKFNNKLSTKDVQSFIYDSEKKIKQFKEELKKDFLNVQNQNQKLNSGNNQYDPSKININSICKKYREKYAEVDSKVIFDQVNLIMENIKLNLTKTQRKEDKSLKHLDDNIGKKQKQKSQATFQQDNKFWDKIKNIKPRLIAEQLNDPSIYQQHKKVTQNKLRFRFPPEPNGYLHIGHVKSIRMNFQTAKRLGGQCYLRYDDTNPQKQTLQYIQQIEKNVRWMGYTPDKINFTSDYFEQMMYYANQLVKQGKAYVCQSTQEEIQLERKQKKANIFRERSKQFSQKIFPNLQPSQTLRLKLDPSSSNPTLRDPIIYRYKSALHPKTGDKYTIYPMYDFAHCISDSLQHIDYSLCSLQFQIRRQLYYKILHLLNLYKPIVWQFSRLNVEKNFISKRKIKQLIDERKIEGWDDPRLLTIKGMQRRGYTPSMLNSFIDKINSSRNGNQKVVKFDLLKKQVKKQFSKQCIKIMALKSPIRLKLNLKSSLNNESAQVQSSRMQNTQYQQILKSSAQILLQQSQIQKIISLQLKQIILKYVGVFQINKNGEQLSLSKSKRTIQQAKRSNQKIPILSWLSVDNYCEKEVVVYKQLLNDNEEFNVDSKKIVKLWLEKKFEKVFNHDSNIKGNQNSKAGQSSSKTVLLERIGYFKKDIKTGDIFCSAEI